MKNKKTAILISVVVASLLIVAVGVYLLLAFVFPYTLAGGMYDMGFNTYAIKLYDRAYAKDNDNIDALYMALNLSIKLDYSDKVVEYFEEFGEKPNYASYVSKIDEANSKKQVEPLIKSTILNEDNYLKNRYVKALITLNKVDEAVEFCKNSIKSNPTTFDMANYYYANFAIDTLSTEQLRFLLDDGIYSNLQNYFNLLEEDFVSSYSLEDRVAERVCAGNRIITVGGNLLYFDARFDNTLLEDGERTEILNAIKSTKQAINLLIME